MLRFRLGQSWKRESGGRPVDAFALDLDGVNLLTGASEESLERVVPELVEAVASLVAGASSAQLSLPEAHLELVLSRTAGQEVELTVVSLGRPARLTRPPVRVELEELQEATLRCGRGLAADLRERAPAMSRSPRQKQMIKQLSSLERASPVAAAGKEEARTARERHAHPPRAPLAFGFELSVAAAQRGGPQRKAKKGAKAPSRRAPAPASAPLAAVLAPGRLWLQVGSGTEAWAAEGRPFLMALELSRQAAELSTALEHRDPRMELQLGGVGPVAVVHLGTGELELEGRKYAVEPAALAAAMFELGQELVLALAQALRAPLKNPYLTELQARCREGLSHLRGAVRPAEGKKQARATRRKEPPRLASQGKLRRLRFEPLWEKTNLGGENAGRLLLGPKGPVFVSVEMACGFTAAGELTFRHVATHGVAATADGRVLTASAQRLLGFWGPESGARWMRDHDGLVLGPRLERKDGLLFGLCQGSTAVAYSELTGRELWRLAPPRTQRSHLALQGHRALLATDSGYLYGLDLHDGQIRYRMRAALPFLTEPSAWGHKLVALIGRGEQAAVVVADAHSGKLHWAAELELQRPCAPLARSGRVLVAGERGGRAQLVCLSGKGTVLWERALPLAEGPYSLVAAGRSVVVSTRRGAAVSVGVTGEVEWRLGEAGADLATPVGARVARGVLLLPGENVRAVDPKGGTVLAEVRAGMGLCDLAVDPRLNLYLLDEDGQLRAFRLATHLALVPGGE